MDHAVAVSQRQTERQSSFQSSETARPDEVKPADGVASQERAGDMESTNLHAQRAEGVRAALEHPQSADGTWRCVRRVSAESRAGGPADRESDESGEQTTQSTSARKHVEERAEAQQKAGEAASGPRGKAESRGRETRRTRARVRRGAARRSQGLASTQEKHSAASAWSTKQRSSRDPIAAGDVGKTGRGSFSQGTSGTFTRSSLSRLVCQRHLVKHVLNGL